MTVTQQAVEYAEVTAVSSMSVYSLEFHEAPRIIKIKNLYANSIDSEVMVNFDCECCGLWYTVARQHIWYKSLGKIEPDLITPT